MSKYYTVVTDTGLNALRGAVQDKSFSLTKAVVGDGDGSVIIPNKGMTTLVNQVWIGDISGIKADSSDPNTLIFEFAIPADTGDFTIREVGLLDSNDQLFCVGNFPETVKPVAEDGSVRDLVVRLPLHFENADVVNLVVNAAVALATKQDLIDHNDDPLAHRRATEDEYGFTQYATPDEHKAKTFRNLACTPFGVWELIKSLMSSSVASSSTDRLATPKAVKTVQDNLNAHNSSSQAHRHATENVAGFTQLAKAEEHLSSSSARRDIAATPYGVWNLLTRVRSDAVDLASTWRFATSKAVNTVMDALNGHTSASDPHHAQARVDSKMQGHLHVNDPHGVVAKVKALLSSSTSSTSTTTFATPKAVKTVNDWLTAHKNGIDPHGTVPRVKALLSSSVTNASTTTFATPKAVKTVNDSLVAHKNTNDPHGVVTKVKSLLTSSTTSTSTTMFATPKAVKIVNDSLNTHKNSSTVHIPSGGSTGEVLVNANGRGRWRKLSLLPAGHIYPVPFPPNELPDHHYIANGEGLLKTSQAGKTLLSMSAAYKTAHRVTETATHVFLPNMFGENGDGYFPRFVDGVTRKVGSTQGDAIRNLSGHFNIRGVRTSNYILIEPSRHGAIKAETYFTGGLSGWGTMVGCNTVNPGQRVVFDASKVVPTAHENRPKNYGFTPAIYLPPLEA